MARNSEKANSMLYRFREAQSVEMGLGNRVKGERRPRMASACSSLRECERWRGDIMRDINRKVSKIQDSGLTDYQIRDLNDEINGLMREKNHWETQIVALGGANYKRGRQAMLDDDGKEVPGTRGYKYFGRAKELPGVREMFTKGAEAATEESARNASFQMFRNQGTEYFGDNDEMDLSLAQDEEALARAEWEQACADMAEILGLPSGSQLPPFPTPSKPLPPMTAGQSSSKRKASPEPASDEVIVDEATKKTKTDAPVESAAAVDQETIARQAAIAASFFSVLDPESMKAPVLASVQEMSQVLLDVRKKALREEYGV
ncbi:pre-mRNA-splicing factor ISY1, partial [Tremellales sp. Uapishka_1]